VSAHYDAALGSYGASDDLSAIATMLEMLRAMTQSAAPSNAVLFNFNGAEENILQVPVSTRRLSVHVKRQRPYCKAMALPWVQLLADHSTAPNSLIHSL